MEPKIWYESKTLWANVISIVGIFLANKFGYTISAEMSVTILGAINTVLRFITKREIVWEK